jgi:hypothetical protein
MLHIGGCLFFPSLCRGVAISILLVPFIFFLYFFALDEKGISPWVLSC